MGEPNFFEIFSKNFQGDLVPALEQFVRPGGYFFSSAPGLYENL